MAALYTHDRFDELIDQVRANPDNSLEAVLEEVWDVIRSPLCADYDDKATSLIALSEAIQEALNR